MYFDLDIHGHQQGRVFAYIIGPQEDSMILGDPWLYDVRGRYSARKGYLDIFTKAGKQTRYWNRANHIIRPTNMKMLRIAQATAYLIHHLVWSLTAPN
jgi:hypothetical protein